ncbi:MAG: HAD-IA family hydrolase [Pseudomonadota bacterium]
MGKTSERRYWKLVQETTGISMSALDMRQKILQSFILKPEMIKIVNLLRAKGFFVSLLSDQTNWLDELDARHHFCRFFDTVFNSYHLGKAKRDPSLFSDVASTLGISNENCLLIDDNHGNVMRASKAGYQTILFQSVKLFIETLSEMALVSHAELKDVLK